MRQSRLLLFLLAGLAACQGDSGEPGASTAAAGAAVAPPLPGLENYYEAAARTHLAEIRPEERPDLHNVFHLSANIVSGSEPHGAAAFRKLADMGVKTILSVDGKAPDYQTAHQHGIRYVHVPIHYNGITGEELLRISKTFHELEGPFYVHCFHGKHRGPAAAAVGRLILDGISREQALAEMRQWCGTSSKYEGLYRIVGLAPIPGAGEAAAYDWDFPPAQQMQGFRGAMVGVSRSFDNLLLLDAAGWQADPEHPDIDPQNEVEILAALFEQAAGLDEVRERPEDFRNWVDESADDARSLLAYLAVARDGAPQALEGAKKAFARIQQNCGACHDAYRNH